MALIWARQPLPNIAMRRNTVERLRLAFLSYPGYESAVISSRYKPAISLLNPASPGFYRPRSHPVHVKDTRIVLVMMYLLTDSAAEKRIASEDLIRLLSSTHSGYSTTQPPQQDLLKMLILHLAGSDQTHQHINKGNSPNSQNTT
jgi:hypothetical protein